MDVRSIPLTANVPARIIVPFRFFMLIETPAAIDVRFLAAGNLSLIGEVGRNVEAGYKRFPLNAADPGERWGGFEMLSTSNQTVRVGVSDSAGDYERTLTTVTLEAPDGLSSAADVVVGAAAEVQLVASNANRKRVHLTSLAANTQPVRVRETLGAATVRGLQLAPGLTLTLDTQAAVYAVSESGNQTIAVLQEVVT